LDVTILELSEGVFEVLATSGDTQLGGRDMDEAIIHYIVEEFKKTEGVDLTKDDMAMQRIREAAEKAKIELSTVMDTEINLPYITADSTGPKHLVMKLSRAKLEELIDPIIEKCKHPVDQAIKDAKLKKEDISKIILVGGPTRIPKVQKFLEDYTGISVERGIDPMECVATGAAIQGAVLAGDMKDILLLDVTPLTLGIETLGGITTPLIPRNTTIPTKKSQIFSTAADNQTAVTINVVQGERTMAKDNTSLGSFNLEGIPPAPKGVPQIEVTFDIDADGILHVSAKDKGTGKEQKISITASTKLSDEEVERMIKEAEEHAEEDKKAKEKVELKNNAESLVYTVDKTLKELGDKVDPKQKEEIEKLKADVSSALGKDDTEELKKAYEALSSKIQEIGASVYQQAANAGQTTDTSKDKEKNKEDENVVDADFEVKDSGDKNKK